MLHGLGSRRARALNQTPSNSNELEKENTSRSHLASQRRNAKTQVSKVAANVEKGAAKRSLQGKPPGKPPGTTALKSKSKSNVTTFPVSGGRDNASKRAISEHDAVPPEKKPKTCRISLAPDCELRVSARSSIKRNAENKQKLTRELFKPISTLLGEKVDVSTSPNNRLELRTRSATVKSQQKKRSRLSISQNATPKGPHNKTSALRLSPLPSEILHLPLEHCSPSKEKSPSEDLKFSPTIKVDHKSLFTNRWFELFQTPKLQGADSFSDLSDDDIPSMNQRIYSHQLSSSEPNELEKSLRSVFEKGEDPLPFKELFSSA